MEEKIEEKLQEIYKNLYIKVNFVEFRRYEIIIQIKYDLKYYESKILYIYDNKYTFSQNIYDIEKIIDNKIILPFYKEKLDKNIIEDNLNHIPSLY